MAQMNNLIDSWGIKWSYAHFKSNAFCLYPKISKLKNIGADKSGTHTSKTDKFNVNLQNNIHDYTFSNELELNKTIVKNLKKFLKLSIQRKLINYIRYNFLLNKN